MRHLFCVLLLVSLTNALASPVNSNIRLFEDTLWLSTFSMMIILSAAMLQISANLTRLGFAIMVATGISGLIWKVIGVVKRVFGIGEPKWFFELTRESFEGLTGLLLAAAFIVLAYSFIKLFQASDLSD